MIYLALGSNLGNRFKNFRIAISKLSSFFDCKILSHVIETQALLPANAPNSWNIPYLNMVIAGNTSIDPSELLSRIKDIEKEMGRDMAGPVWSPRIIDIDIVSYNNQTIKSEKLNIPHKGIKDRDFLQYLLEDIGYSISDEIKLDINEYSALNHFVLDPKIVGIVNVTPDSFSDGGKFFDEEKAVNQVNQLYADGACVIELGAQSTRPNYTEISPKEEILRLRGVLENTQGVNCLGIDTYFDEVAKFVIEKYDLKWINDIKANFCDSTIKLIADKNAKFITMLYGTDISWFEDRVNYLQTLGIKRENIILDPGIGFGKTRYESIDMIKHISKIKERGYEVLLGHSRKSFMAAFSNEEAQNRDIETIAISNFALQKNIDYIRIHNVRDHMRFFVTNQQFYSKSL